MNKKIMILLFFTILILNSIFALDCQYTESVFDHTEIKAVPYSIDDDDPIELITYIIAGTIKAPIYFFNENDFNVDIEFDLIYYAPGGYSGNLGQKSSHIIKTIIPGTNEMPFGYSNGYYNSILNLIYRENDFVYLKNKEERIYKTICTVCGDTNCLNDGLACSINSECGSGNCILGKCSSDTNCYNNDCNCASNQIQYNNQKCIDKGSVTIGGKSITGNPEECVTKYISSVTGNCAVSLGDPCTKNLDCAENYCVMGVCSDNDTNCYRNNCNCNSNQIQFNNKQCDLKYTVINGNRPPFVNPDYCMSRYIDPNTGLCGITPDQKLELELKNQKEHRNFLMILIICFVIFVVAFVVYNIYIDKKGKSIIAKVKDITTGTKDIDKIGKELEIKIDKLEKNLVKSHNQKSNLENTLADINHKINATHNDKTKLAKLLAEKENIKIKIEDKDDEIIEQTKQLKTDQDEYKDLIKEGEKIENIVRFDSKVGREVIKISHLGGYECFYDKNKNIKEYTKANLVHLSVWRQKHGRNPKFGYVIHHKDFNKYNNDPENLIEMRIEDHDKLHHKDRYKK